MSNILEDLWYGEIEPAEMPFAYNKEHKDLNALMLKYEQTLEKMLDEEQRIVFRKYQDCQMQLSSLVKCQLFKHSFCLGGKFAIAMLSDER